MSKVTVLGAGAWGSTMAQVLSDAGNHVLMWGRNQEIVNEINTTHTNRKYLDENVLPLGLSATTDLKQAFEYSNIYVLAVPAQTLRENLKSWKPLVDPTATYISTLKGIEVSTLSRMTEIIQEEMKTENFALITGPNLATELILRQPAGAVAAAPTKILAEKTLKLFATPYYRVYTSTDVLGCELAGSIKSVIALAVGISIGMGFGENTQAMLITRGLNEVARLCAAHGADPLSAAGLAGMGDLVASCGSPLSRNRTFGEVLGRSGSMAVAR
jgi:glycerol-3-phosphate dehydrogenase (NAD(P)+)